jgi:hypothetical protein
MVVSLGAIVVVVLLEVRGLEGTEGVILGYMAMAGVLTVKSMAMDGAGTILDRLLGFVLSMSLLYLYPYPMRCNTMQQYVILHQ